MFKYQNITKVVKIAVLSSACCMVPHIANAQDGADEVEKISITGSRIKRTDMEGPSPVVTIMADDMLNKGFVTVQDALNNLTQATGGQLDQQQTFGFTPSASAVDIRGFGVGRTLVLLNGRRLPQFPLAAGGTSNFVDLSSIPSSAVARIEVLTDGASAIYGSDAIGGVVNVILKNSVEKTQVNVRYGDTSEGGQQNSRVQITTGLETNKGSALFFFEYLDRDELLFSERDRSAFDVLDPNDPASVGAFSSGGVPGTFRGTEGNVPSADCDPNLVIGGFCRFNRADFRQLLAPLKRGSIATLLHYDINENISAFGQFMYVKTQVDTQIEPMFFDEAIVVGIDAPNNPTTGENDPTGIYVDQAGIFRRRLIEFGPRAANIDTDSINMLMGLKGTIYEDFDWELGYNYSKQDVVSVRSGFAARDRITNAMCGPQYAVDGSCDNGTLNFFEPISQEVVDALRLTPLTDAESTISAVDFQVTGPLFEMNGEDAMFAAIVEYNKTTFRDARDPDQLNGNIIALGGTSGRGERKYSAAGLEVLLPIIDNFNLSIAGRYDSYDDDSDVGGAFSPRVALDYRPIKNLLLRTSWAESFRAPDMQRLFGANTRAFTDLVDTPFCLQQGGSGRGDTSVPSCSSIVQSTEILLGSNINLQEEKGESVNLGFVFSVTDNFSIGADIFSIKLEGIVEVPDTQFILDNPSLFPSNAIVRDPNQVDTNDNPGGLDIISAVARNLAFQKTEGVDFNIDYSYQMQQYGDFTLRLNGTYTSKVDIQQNSESLVVDELKGFEGRSTEGVEWRANLNLGWSLNDISVNLYANYIGEIIPAETSVIQRLGSWTTFNLTTRYVLTDSFEILAGVNNLLDKEPPIDIQDGNSTQPFYNQSFHNLTGREYYVEAQYRF
jgi:iron complex outermembrane receptor protein